MGTVPAPKTVHRDREEFASLPISAAITTRGKELDVADTVAAARRFFALHPVSVLPLLDEGTRATLLELGRGRALRLDGTGLRLSDVVTDFDPAALPAVIERMAALVKHLARQVNVPPGAGYR